MGDGKDNDRGIGWRTLAGIGGLAVLAACGVGPTRFSQSLLAMGLVVVTVGEKQRRLDRHNDRLDQLARTWRGIGHTTE